MDSHPLKKQSAEESDQQARALSAALHRVLSVVEFDRDGTVLNANDHFLYAFGYTINEIVGKHHRIFCESDYTLTDEYRQFWEKLGQGDYRSGEFIQRAKTGQVVWVNATYTPVSDSTGRVYKIIQFSTDISKQKLQNADNEGKIRAIGKSTVMIEFNLDGTVITANDTFLKATGYSLEEIRGRHHSLFCERDYAQSREYIEFWEKLGRGQFEAGEYKRIGKNGKELWLSASYNPIVDGAGKPLKIVKFASDVTLQKQQSAEFEGKLRAIGKSQAVIEFALDGTVITANENFLKATAYHLDEVVGHHHRMFCTPEHANSQEYRDFWTKLSRGEFDSGIYRRVGKGGKRIWINASYNPIFDINGKPCKIIKYATEVTQETLRNAEFEGKLEAIGKSQAIIEFGMDGTIIAANEIFLTTFGFHLAELVGKHHRILCEPRYAASNEYRTLWEKLNRGEFDTGEYKRIAKNGDALWIVATYSPIFDPNGKPFKVVKFATDVTQAKLRNAEFEGKVNAIGKSQAVIEFGLDGSILDANENFLSTFGYSSKEIAGRHHRMFCDNKYSGSNEYQEMWQRLAAGQFETGEYKRIGKGGKEIWINASYNPIFDMDGRPFKVVKFATDVTTVKLAAAESAVKLNAIDQVQAVIEFKLDGTILNANEIFLRSMGYELPEIVGKHHRIFCDEEFSRSLEYKQFWLKLSAGEFHSGRFKRVARNGKPVWLNAMYYPVTDLNGAPVKIAKFATVITQDIELECAVRATAEAFSLAAKDISDRSSGVAHRARSLGATTKVMIASIDVLTASIDSIAGNSKDADALARTTQGDAEDGSKTIAQSIIATELIGKASRDIEEIVKVISDIADQTNLLAFNAAIEAARAGEHGLGFSVVADEVRKLSERASTATKDISKLIGESVKRINEGSAISQQAGLAFEKIVGGITKTTEAISQISDAAAEQLLAARELSNAIHQVASETEESVVASDNIANSTGQLLQGAQELAGNASKLAA
jgi:methyl-accepting chemotaxis protein